MISVTGNCASLAVLLTVRWPESFCKEVVDQFGAEALSSEPPTRRFQAPAAPDRDISTVADPVALDMICGFCEADDAAGIERICIEGRGKIHINSLSGQPERQGLAVSSIPQFHRPHLSYLPPATLDWCPAVPQSQRESTTVAQMLQDLRGFTVTVSTKILNSEP